MLQRLRWPALKPNLNNILQETCEDVCYDTKQLNASCDAGVMLLQSVLHSTKNIFSKILECSFKLFGSVLPSITYALRQ